jgi:hypothetical protein
LAAEIKNIGPSRSKGLRLGNGSRDHFGLRE